MQSENGKPETTALLPLEIAARAIVRVDTVSYPDTKAGRDRATAYVEANWRGMWEKLQS